VIAGVISDTIRAATKGTSEVGGDVAKVAQGAAEGVRVVIKEPFK